MRLQTKNGSGEIVKADLSVTWLLEHAPDIGECDRILSYARKTLTGASGGTRRQWKIAHDRRLEQLRKQSAAAPQAAAA